MADNNIDVSYENINKIYRYMKNGESVETFMKRFNLKSFEEVSALVEYCSLYGLNISLKKMGDSFCFKKVNTKFQNITKPDMDSDELNHLQLCVVSDTHFGSIHQQLHLLNEIYEEAYKRGITTVLHCGDIVDGNYPNRPENPRQQFLHGFDEQCGYVCDMYPDVNNIDTYYILGSHDETHYKNGNATMEKWIGRCRKDMHFLGQDTGYIELNKVRILMDHPGGGSSSGLSYKPQKRIELLESGNKPNLLLIGHYHKSYSFVYRNVRCIEVPALCDKTQFQTKQGLINTVGAYFLDIYCDKKGNIIYFEPEEILYGKKDMWEEAAKDKRKVRQLVID